MSCRTVSLPLTTRCLYILVAAACIRFLCSRLLVLILVHLTLRRPLIHSPSRPTASSRGHHSHVLLSRSHPGPHKMVQ